MSTKTVVTVENGLRSPLISQAIIHNDTIYVSGNIGIDPTDRLLVLGSVADRTRQAILNLQAVLEVAGSNLQNILKANIYLKSMHDYSAMNDVWMAMIPDPKPARTVVAVTDLRMGTDVEIDCTAHL